VPGPPEKYKLGFADCILVELTEGFTIDFEKGAEVGRSVFGAPEE
jgi:hypothetical protein